MENEQKIADSSTRSAKVVREINLQQLIEMQRQAYLNQKIAFLPIIDELAKAGKWEEFCAQVEVVYEVMPEAFTYYYKDMPEEYRRNFVIECYMNHGDSLEECRKALVQLPKNGVNELPQGCREQPYIIIYRAGEENISEARNRLSWTLDIKTAEFFMYTWRSRHANAIYKAKIKPCDVIAFTNERNEQEVMQFQSVYDIERIV